MAIAFDAGTVNRATSVASQSLSHSTSGSDRYLVVSVCVNDPHTVSAVTYNGVSLTQITTRSSPGTGVAVDQWGLIAPATGSNTVAVTYSATNTGSAVAAVSYTGVAQTSPVSGTATNTNSFGLSGSVDIASTSGNLVVGACATSGGSLASGAGQTTRAGGGALDGTYDVIADDEPGASSVTMSYTWGLNRFWAAAGFSLAAAAGGASPETVIPGFIASTATVYTPTVAPGAVQVQPGLIASTAQVFAPTVAPGAVQIQPATIASTAQVFAPTVAPGAVQIAPTPIASTATVHAPTLAVGGVTLEPGFIASTATVYAPTVAFGAVAIVPSFLASTATVYQPTVGEPDVDLYPATGAITIIGRPRATATIDGHPLSTVSFPTRPISSLIQVRDA